MIRRRLVRSLFCSVIVILLSVALTPAQEKKDVAPKRGQLPQNWSKLGLSDEQKAKVYAIQAEYKAKIDEIKKQMEELQKQERRALEAVLTPAQKNRLRELLLEKVPGAGSGSDKP
jgi:Spy/CpxP family protein refolding chaperone